MSNELRKAAVMLLSLPDEEAAMLLSLLEPKLVEAVCVEMARVDHVADAEQAEVVTDFVRSGAGAAGSSGGLARVQKLLQRALGQAATAALDHVRQTINAPPLSSLKNVEGRTLLAALYDEHPQTIAIVLAHLPTAKSAEVLSGLPARQRLLVMSRLATMGPLKAEIVREVERGLSSRLAELAGGQYELTGGAARAAEILRLASPDVAEMLLSSLAQQHPDLAAEIRRGMCPPSGAQQTDSSDAQGANEILSVPARADITRSAA